MGRTVRLIYVTCALVLGCTSMAAAADPGTGSAAAAATPAVRVLPGEYSFGMALALDAGGHRHIVAADREGDLWYATDRSGSWASQEILPGPALNEGDWPAWAWTSPAVAIDSDGSVHVAVVRSTTMDTPGSTWGIYYLTDQGRPHGDFGPRAKITGDGMAGPSLRVVDGVRYLAYTKCACLPEQKSAPLYFKTDRYTGWRMERIDGWASAPSMRVASDGRAHIAYQDENGLRYTRARSKTGDFTAPIRIPGSTGKAGEPSLALDAAKQPHVAWATWSSRAKPILYAKRTARGWVVPRQVGVGWAAELSLDAQARPHVVFARGYGSGKVVHRWLAAGTWQRRTMVEGEGIGGVDVRAFGNGASVAWSQWTKPRGIWVAPG